MSLSDEEIAPVMTMVTLFSSPTPKHLEAIVDAIRRLVAWQRVQELADFSGWDALGIDPALFKIHAGEAKRAYYRGSDAV